ncbi:hypothetical protein ACP4OV_014926 [Aristida adscensionis]
MVSVQVVESCLVVPSEATPMKELWLSPLDMVAPGRDTPLLFFYAADDGAADFLAVAARLKAALAKTLVAFYPLAGRLGVDGDGRLMVSCNAEGALFVVARSSLPAHYFDSFKPSHQQRLLFLPRLEPSSLIMAVQMTLLKNGGVALGLVTNHAVVDAASASHFLQTWSSFARDGGAAGGGGGVELPCHERALLRARSPPVVHPDALLTFCPRVPLSPHPPGAIANEVLLLSGEQVASLKRLCGGGATSTFSAVSALVWQCVCAARRLRPEAEARLMFPANIRRRVPRLIPGRYFGNAVVELRATAAARDITSEALAATAGRIGGAIARVDEELVRSAVDYYAMKEETQRSSPRRRTAGSLGETDLKIVSWLGMRLEADFGWGMPRLTSRAESARGGYVYLINGGPAGEGAAVGVRLLVCMEAANINDFQRLLYATLVDVGGQVISKL